MSELMELHRTFNSRVALRSHYGLKTLMTMERAMSLYGTTSTISNIYGIIMDTVIL